MTHSINNKARKKKLKHGLNMSKKRIWKMQNLSLLIRVQLLLKSFVTINHLFHFTKKETQSIFTYVAD